MSYLINNKGIKVYIMTSGTDKKELILDSAIELFNRWGFAKTSVD